MNNRCIKCGMFKGLNHNCIKSINKMKNSIYHKNLKGKNNPMYGKFKEKSSYTALHFWIQRELGKAMRCRFCGKDSGRIEWANINHEYKRDLTDWISLCRRCHKLHDIKIGPGRKKFELDR